MPTPTMIVLCGMSGAGKSTWAAKQRGYVLLSADALRTESGSPKPRAVFAVLHRELEKSLRAGKNVIVDTCALLARTHEELLKIGERCHARCELVIVDTPVALCMRRNGTRHAPAVVQWKEAQFEECKNVLSVSRQWARVSVVKGC